MRVIRGRCRECFGTWHGQFEERLQVMPGAPNNPKQVLFNLHPFGPEVCIIHILGVLKLWLQAGNDPVSCHPSRSLELQGECRSSNGLLLRNLVSIIIIWIYIYIYSMINIMSGLW